MTFLHLLSKKKTSGWRAHFCVRGSFLLPTELQWQPVTGRPINSLSALGRRNEADPMISDAQ